MKKMSKIFAALAAMMTVCSSIPAIASAEFNVVNYREYNGVDIFTNGNPYEHYDKAYISNDNTHFMLLEKVENTITFVPADGVDYKEIFTALSGLRTEAGFAYKVYQYGGYQIQAGAYEITENDAKEVYATLKDSGLVTELVFHNERYRTHEKRIGGKTYENKHILTTYGHCYGSDKNEQELLKEYFESHNIQNYTVEDIYYKGIWEETYFIPDESVTFEEQLALVQDIAEELGILPGLVGLLGFDTSVDVKYDIDLFEYVEGDANLDSSLNLADSVAVMQSIANPDQYELTPQGKFNADIDGNGLTTGDALEIQKQLLNVK